MERTTKKQIFQMDGRLKQDYNRYCDRLGLVQEHILEALVYLLVKKNLAGMNRDDLMQEVADWKESKD
jgi:hypothetical protein